jgi:hypothetical protein
MLSRVEKLIPKFVGHKKRFDSHRLEARLQQSLTYLGLSRHVRDGPRHHLRKIVASPVVPHLFGKTREEDELSASLGSVDLGERPS